MMIYAKSALAVAEAHRLNIDMIKDQLGARSAAAMSYQGGETRGPAHPR